MENKGYRVAIIEDEQEFSDRLRNYFDCLEKEQKVSFEIDQYLVPLNFLEKFQCQYDLICLDIQMPGYNGFEVAQEIRKSDPSVLIILITSFAQFAIQGYSIHAFDYILKPFSYTEFQLKMNRALLTLDSGKTLYGYNRENIRCRISTARIKYLEIFNHKVIIHSQGGEYFLYSSLNICAKELPEDSFLRIKSCYLVAKKEIVGFKDGQVILKDGTCLSSSRSMKDAIISLINSGDSKTC